MSTNATDGGPRLSDEELDALARDNQGLGDLFGKGLRSGGNVLMAQGNKLAGTVMDANGMDGSGRHAASADWQRDAETAGEGMVPYSDVKDVRSGVRFAAGGLGSSLPMMAPVIGAGLMSGGAALPTALAGAAAMLPFEMGQNLQRAEADPANANTTAAQRLKAVTLPSAGAAALQTIVPAGVAMRLAGKGAAAGLRTIPGRAAADIAMEAGAEGGAEGLRQVGDNQLNPNAGYNAQAIKDAAGAGALVGGAFAGVGAAGHVVNKAVGAPGNAMRGIGSAAEALAGRAGEAVGAAKDKVQGSVASGVDAASDALPPDVLDKVESWLKSNISDRVPAVKAWAKQMSEAAGTPDEMRAQLADVTANPGDKAKQAWMATQKFTADAATKAKAALDERDIPTRLNELYRSGKDKATDLMDRMANGTEVADPSAPDQAGAQAAADQTTLSKAKQWAEELATENLGEAKTAQLKAAAADLSNKANQQAVAALKKGQVAVAETRAAIDRFVGKVKDKADGAAGAKKSEDYSGARKVIGDSIRAVLGDDHPALQSTESINRLADGLRPYIDDVANGKALDSMDKLDRLAALHDALGDQTTVVLKAVHSAVSGAGKDDTALFKNLNQMDAVLSGRQSLLETQAKNLKPELQGKVSMTELRTENDVLSAWARRKITDPADVEKAAFDDRAIRKALTVRYGDKADTVLAAVEKSVKAEQSALEGKSPKTKASLDSDESMGDEDTGDAAFTTKGKEANAREGKAADQISKQHIFPTGKGKDLYLHPDYEADNIFGSFGSPAQRMLEKAKTRYPDASVQFRRVSELDATDPTVKAAIEAQRANLAVDADEHGLTGDKAKAWIDKELENYGLITAEESRQETAINAGELKNITLDTKKHGGSPSRINADKDVTIDAVKLTNFMGKKLGDHYTDIDDKGPAYRTARMFKEGIAAVQDYVGKTFEVPDSTVISKSGLTWGQARKLKLGTEADKANDADTRKLVDLRREYKEAKTKAEQEKVREKARDILSAKEFALIRDQLAQDYTPADRETDLRRGAELRKQLDRADQTPDQVAALTKRLDAIERRLDPFRMADDPFATEVDPFGPTGTTLKGNKSDRGRIDTDGGEARVEGAGAPTALGGSSAAKSGPLPEPKGKPAKAAEVDPAHLDAMLSAEDYSSLDTREKVDQFLKDARVRFDQLRNSDEDLFPEELKALATLYNIHSDTFDTASLYDGVPPDPKALAAKQAAFVEKARSGDQELLKALSTSTDAKGLQRAANHLADMDGVDGARDAITARLRELVADPDTAYGLQTTRYSLQGTNPGNTQTANLRAAVEAHINTVLGPSVRTEWANILHAGEFDPTATGDVIRLSVHALNPMGVAYHESLHGLMKRLHTAGQGDIGAVLKKAGEGAVVMNQLRRLLANEPAALAQLTNPEERAAYMYQFWAQGQLTVGEKATTVFGRIAEFIRKVTGLWTNDERALKIMEYFQSGEYQANAGNPNAVHSALMESSAAKALKTLSAATEPLRNIGETLASAGGTRLRDSGIPALRELANVMKLKTTTEGQDAGYMPAARAERARVMNKLGDDLAGYTPQQLAEALESMQTGNAAASPEARLAARVVRKHLDESLAYMQAAGVRVDHIGVQDGVPYFPRSWDASYISSHQQDFLAMLSRHGLGADTMHKLMVTDGAEFNVEVDKPGMQHAKQRVLSVIPHDEAAQFMRKDLFQIMNSYVTQATRRAEWARRLGDDGSGVTRLINEARAQGATQSQIDTARNFVRAVDGTLGDTINPTARRLIGNAIVYQNLRLLPLAIFSSAVDAQGIIVRGGTVGEGFNTFKRGFREMVKNFQKNPARDDMTRLAETLGVVDNAMLVHTLGASYSQGMVGDTGRAINDKFFRFNLMEQFNTSMRVGATEAAMGFLARHATQPEQHSARFLRELGLTAADVQLDAAGRPKLLEADGLTTAQAAKMKMAVNRWVDGAVLRPDAVDKPVWMSDPMFALVAHLKQFVFSFHETILKRVVHEAQQGNYRPGMALASYVPMMIAADLAKGFIQGGGEEPPWKAGWGASDYMWSGMERAGVFGVGQFGLDALTSIKRGDSGIGALAGPTLEQLGDSIEVLAGRREFGSFALKSMPANALYAGVLDGESTDPKFSD